VPTNLFILKLSAFKDFVRLKKTQAIILLFFFLPISGIVAQIKTIDSLKKVLPSLHDTARVNCLNALSKLL
jgi:hypothetical protein